MKITNLVGFELSSSQINPKEDLQLRIPPPQLKQAIIDPDPQPGVSVQELSDLIVTEIVKALSGIPIDKLLSPEHEIAERLRQPGALRPAQVDEETADLEVAHQRHIVCADPVLQHVQEHVVFEDDGGEVVEDREVFFPELAAGEEDLPGGAGLVVGWVPGFAASEGQLEPCEEVGVYFDSEFGGEALQRAGHHERAAEGPLAGG